MQTLMNWFAVFCLVVLTFVAIANDLMRKRREIGGNEAELQRLLDARQHPEASRLVDVDPAQLEARIRIKAAVQNDLVSDFNFEIGRSPQRLIARLLRMSPAESVAASVLGVDGPKEALRTSIENMPAG